MPAAVEHFVVCCGLHGVTHRRLLEAEMIPRSKRGHGRPIVFYGWASYAAKRGLFIAGLA